MNEGFLNELGLESVLGLYMELDTSIGRLKEASGHSCVLGCGVCCENPNIEATMLEFLPLGVMLWKSGLAEVTMNRLINASLSGVCVFYEKDENSPGNGSCKIYPYRGLICRLFGFSAIYNKTGEAVLASCPPMKKSNPEILESIRTKLQTREWTIPIFSEYYQKLSGINPNLTAKYYPINEAMYKMLEKIGLLIYYFNQNGLEK